MAISSKSDHPVASYYKNDQPPILQRTQDNRIATLAIKVLKFLGTVIGCALLFIPYVLYRIGKSLCHKKTNNGSATIQEISAQTLQIQNQPDFVALEKAKIAEDAKAEMPAEKAAVKEEIASKEREALIIARNEKAGKENALQPDDVLKRIPQDPLQVLKYSADQLSKFTEEEKFSIIKYMIESNSDIAIEPLIIDERFNFKQKHRFELAKIYIEKSKNYESINSDKEFEEAINTNRISIEKYNLTEIQRFELAKLCVLTWPLFTSRWIKKFELNQQQRFLVAKLAFGKDGIAAKFITEFEFNDEQQRYELAKLIVEHSRRFDPKCFKEFAFKDSQQRYELAFMAFNRHFFSEISDYNIHDEQQCFTLAQIAAQYSCRHVMEFIPLKDEQKRYEVARILFAKSVYASNHIESFDLHDQHQLFELAKLACRNQSSFECLLENLKHFGLSDELQRFELAKIALDNMIDITKHIPYLGLTLQHRFEILTITFEKIICKEHRRFLLIPLIKNLKTYDLSEELLFKLIQSILLRHPRTMSIYEDWNDLFPFKDQDMRFELVKILANQKGNRSRGS